jgi:hypothetical protein
MVIYQWSEDWNRVDLLVKISFRFIETIDPDQEIVLTPLTRTASTYPVAENTIAPDRIQDCL